MPRPVKGYAWLHVRGMDTETRTIKGIASTPEPDRAGDVIEPLGITFKNPVPLLLYHDTKSPVGLVTFDSPTPEGLTFSATLPTITESGKLRDRVDEAWHSIKSGLLAAVSIGFRSIEDAYMRESDAWRFIKSEILELSLVSIPMNQDAAITSVRSFVQSRTALSLPVNCLGVSGRTHTTLRGSMTIQEQIAAFENTRAAKSARMVTLMSGAADKHETLAAAEVEEYDTLSAEVRSVDDHLVRLRALETMTRQTATALPQRVDETTASTVRGGSPVITVKANVPPATAFTRAVMALVSCRGNRLEAAEWAKQWRETTPEVEMVLRAAVAPGNTTDATWAGPLVQLQPLAKEFLDYLRPATILGKIPNFRQVPFNISIPNQTAGGSYGWVGQGVPKPVTKIAFGTVTLTFSKATGIIVITEELARFSTPSAEVVIRNEMVAGIAQFLDSEFLDPTKAPVANVSPGSITNGVTPITTSGTTPANARTDIIALANAMTAANISPSTATLIMSETNALALGAALNPLGQPLFPEMNATGGTAFGFKVVTSQTAGNNVVLVSAPNVLYADDGGVSIDVSREASVQLDTAPDNPPLATTVLTSLWQENLVGLRCERYINWKRARAGSVQYTVATYTA